MSYKFSFADNEVYSATDVNNITKRLVTSGIADSFSDGKAYNVSDFNEMGKLLYTSGVVSEDCNTLKVTKVSDTEILINPGTAFFDDGAVIEIEAGGELLSFVSGSKNYVYLKNNLIEQNKCYPCCTTQEPAGDYVKLAEIDENGEIIDKRTYAKGRLPGYQSITDNVLRIQDYIEVTKEAGATSGYSGSKTFDIGNNNFEYILSYVKRDSYSFPCLGIYDIQNQTYLGFGCSNDKRSDDGTNHWYYQAGGVSENSIYVSYYGSSADAEFDLADGKLSVTIKTYRSDKGYNIDLILF